MLIKFKQLLSNKVKIFIIKVMTKLHLNNRFILFTTKKAKKNFVNLNYCFNFKNLGDNISPVIVDFVAKKRGINLNKHVNGIKHLYAIGSIITAGSQDCTIWGSGLLNTLILNRLSDRKLDIRAVRGPLTRIILLDQGFNVPEIYGDPAILMPLIYDRKIEKKHEIGLITHFNESVGNDLIECFYRINIVTDNYKKFVDEVKSCNLIVSSSLHGIIFAEAYGVPAILLKPRTDLLKYFDYYYSTGRYQFPIIDKPSDYSLVNPPLLPNFKKMQMDIISSFPVDLWEC